MYPNQAVAQSGLGQVPPSAHTTNPGPPRTTASGAASSACTPCRTVKMRCEREPGDSVCNRCKRKSLTCYYEMHRRGRKPGTKLRPKAERDRERALKRVKQEAIQGPADYRPTFPQPHQADPTFDSFAMSGLSLAGSQSPAVHNMATQGGYPQHPQIPMMMPEDNLTQADTSIAGQYKNDLQYQPASAASPTSVETHFSGSEVPLIGVEPPMAHTSAAPAAGLSTSAPGSTMLFDTSSMASASPAVSTAGSVATSGIGGTSIPDELTPYGLLKKSTTAGNFTIANILDADNEDSESESNPRPGDAPDPDSLHTGSSDVEERGEGQEKIISGESNDAKDPISRGLVSLPTAQQLYHDFFTHMNPFIYTFDPQLHTFDYVRERSSFLFTTILCYAAKFFNNGFYKPLYKHVEALLSGIMISGEQSTEIIQGLCVNTFWKEPSDSRTWLRLGYAIRASMEMGYHQLHPTNLTPDMRNPAPEREREREIREARNRERTWLMLFIYDRSISLQVGKPWMIPIDSLIQTAHTWHEHAHAVPGTDQVMAALVQLRMLGSELLSLFWMDPATFTPDIISKNEARLQWFNSDIDRWEAHWHRIVDEASEHVSHGFMVTFYGKHLRLVLNSYRVQLWTHAGAAAAAAAGGGGGSGAAGAGAGAGRSLIPNQALSFCHVSALEMLRLLVDKLGTRSLLIYLQDSVHAMIAYAVVDIVKILLSLPGELSAKCESHILSSIAHTGEAFAGRNPAPNSSCYHQARFLSNVARQYERNKSQIVAMPPRGNNGNNNNNNNWARQAGGGLPTTTMQPGGGGVPAATAAPVQAKTDANIAPAAPFPGSNDTGAVAAPPSQLSRTLSQPQVPAVPGMGGGGGSGFTYSGQRVPTTHHGPSLSDSQIGFLQGAGMYNISPPGTAGSMPASLHIGMGMPSETLFAQAPSHSQMVTRQHHHQPQQQQQPHQQQQQQQNGTHAQQGLQQVSPYQQHQHQGVPSYQISPEQQIANIHNPLFQQQQQQQQAPRPTTSSSSPPTSADNNSNNPNSSMEALMPAPMGFPGYDMSSRPTSSGDGGMSFADSMAWEDMFANAGFSIHNAAFLPSQ